MSPKLFILTALMTIAFTGCTYQLPTYPLVVPKTQPKPKPKIETKKMLTEPKTEPNSTPTKTPETKELKDVQDDNFDPEYMYPDTPKRAPKVATASSSTNTAAGTSPDTMSKEECIGMIGQEKFDKYTRMLGSASAAIKRCILLKSMQ